MAENPITVNLPADLPEDWAENQIVAPEGQSAGLTRQHGYNYLMEQVNNAQTAANEIGAAFAGLAPGGFGLGAPARIASSANDCKLSGWYMTAFNVPNAPDGDGGYWLIRVDGRDDTVLYQTAYANQQNSGVPNSVICRRYYVNSEWSPWEYITPPMQLGVEYRTSERYNSKPVYVKAVNIGELPTGYGEKEVEHGVSDMGACIELKGFAGQRNLILSRGVTAVTVNSDSIFIEKDSGFSAQSEVVAIIKYTKTTD